MSSASSPNPQNLILLGVLGVGAYWFMTRRAVAQPMLQPLPYGPSVAAQNAGALGGLIGTVANLFRGSGTPLLGTVDGRAATQWDVTPSYGAPGVAYNNPSAYVAGGTDGLAYNPVTSAPYDSFIDYGQYL